MKRPPSVPRAALVPLGSRLRGLDRSFAARAAALSLGEAAPTHLFLVGDPLPAELAASAAAAGRIFFGAPGLRELAEGGETAPEAEPGMYRLKLRGVGPVLRVPEASLAPLGERVEVAWEDEVVAAAPRELPVRVVRLAPLDGPRTTTGLLAPDREIEEAIHAWPEARFAGARFARSKEGVYLTSRSGDALAGLRGLAFHGIELDRRCVLHLPLGRGVADAAARTFLSRRLAVEEGLVCFWREEGRIETLREAGLAPLTRRAWRSAR